jgi:hypothetical protein
MLKAPVAMTDLDRIDIHFQGKPEHTSTIM